MSNQTLNLVNNIVKSAEQRRVAKLILENETFDGKKVILDNNELLFFGSYSYLGLEVDRRLKEAAIHAIIDYGIQYPSSRIYSSLPIYRKLEELMSQIFDANVVLTTSLSLGHMGVMPVIIKKNDILILDQHVHSSVQDAALKLKASGIKVTVIRHNDIVDLEDRIKSYLNKFDRVWYAIDGIYSMYGDTAKIYEIETLLKKYSNFHVYADDAHGASSFGPNGSGWILSKIKLHPRLILSTGMAKAFGTMGGVFIIKDNSIYNKVKNCTGSLIFSGPHPIPVIGASVKSAEIHLTSEINDLQNQLQLKIKHCHELLKLEGIPEISAPDTPIFFVPVGKLNAGYSLVRRMIDDGYLTNLASFPAVSESCTGVRFTITNHHDHKDIEGLVQAFKRNYPVVLNEENVSIEQVRRAFRKVSAFPKYVIDIEKSTHNKDLKFNMHHSILAFDQYQWNNWFKSGCQFDWNTLHTLEKVFRNNDKEEHNWDFIYCTVTDGRNNIIMVTFFTVATLKEDMLSAKDISIELEEKRKDNMYYLSSKMMLMGTQLTEGNHLYSDKNSENWKDALTLIIEQIELERDRRGINSILFRDFDLEDEHLSDFLKGSSFLKIGLPSSHQVLNFDWESENDFLSVLNKKRRKYVRDRAVLAESRFEIEIKNQLDDHEIQNCYQLYQNVNNKSLEINTYDLPDKLFKSISDQENWEFIIIRRDSTIKNEIVAMLMCFRGSDSYHPVLIGLNYDYLNQNIYPVTLWQAVKRANDLTKYKLYFGFTASLNKRKFGAEVIKKCAYVKSRDNFNQMLLNLV